MKPMLCDKITYEQALQLSHIGGWIVEQKYDGLRAYIENGKLWDRRGKDITQQFPEFVGLSSIKELVDGEIIAQSGEFNDISGRVHLRDPFAIRVLAKKSPARFMAFDMVTKDKLDIRKSLLAGLQNKYSWLEVSAWEDLTRHALEQRWQEVWDKGYEGLVIKHRESTYQEGVRSPIWLKLKSFCETTAVFTKLEVHPRGVRLETDDGKSVNVNGAQAKKVQEQFDKQGYVTCEVQFLPQNNSEAWRFPSFRALK